MPWARAEYDLMVWSWSSSIFPFNVSYLYMINKRGFFFLPYLNIKPTQAWYFIRCLNLVKGMSRGEPDTREVWDHKLKFWFLEMMIWLMEIHIDKGVSWKISKHGVWLITRHKFEGGGGGQECLWFFINTYHVPEAHSHRGRPTFLILLFQFQFLIDLNKNRKLVLMDILTALKASENTILVFKEKQKVKRSVATLHGQEWASQRKWLFKIKSMLVFSHNGSNKV